MGSTLSLTGVRAIVTGGASGIGLATVAELAGAGARVLVLDTQVPTAGSPATANGGTLDFQIVDITDETAVEAAVAAAAAEWGGIDILYNVAGVVIDTTADIREVSLDVWNRVIEINLTGSFIVSKAVARVMIPQGSGTIALVGSQGGVSAPASTFPYGASKGGTNGLAMTLDASLRAHGLRVISVLPASIDTPLLRAVATAAGASIEEAISHTNSVEGMGELLALLAHPASGYLRGAMVTL